MGKRRKSKTVPGRNTEDGVKKSIKDPDPNSQDFMYDEAEKFHLNQDKIMLDPSQKNSDESDLDEEMDEEVLDVQGESSDDDIEEEGDIEDEEIEEDDDSDDDEDSLKNDENKKTKAWGRNKNIYYDADVQDEDVYTSDEDAENTAVEEEKEAMILQKRLAEQFQSEDFYDVVDEKNTLSHKVSIDKDFTQLKKTEKLKLLAEDAPELLPLVDEYQEKFKELKEVFHPLMLVVKHRLIPNAEGVQYIKMKHQLLLNYLVNISFYFALKLSKENTKGHPVVDVLVQHQQFFSQLKEVDEKLKLETSEILSKYQPHIENNFSSFEPPEVLEEKSDIANVKTDVNDDKLLNNKEVSELDMDPLEYYNLMKSKSKKAKQLANSNDVNEEVSEEYVYDAEGKRMITYEMSKNKGLIRNRRKELKNPRVKHKVKFKKAVVKRKGQVKEIQNEMSRYAGETTGIKASLSRSTKIK